MSRNNQKRRFGVKTALLLAGLAASPLFATGAHAQDLIGSYVAYIGQPDLYNSKGDRLTQPWQILRQDRANFHRFGISQSGDEFDPFFGSISNRKIMERMVKNGSIDPQAAKRLVDGGSVVFLRIFGNGNTGTSVKVTVAK